MRAAILPSRHHRRADPHVVRLHGRQAGPRSALHCVASSSENPFQPRKGHEDSLTRPGSGFGEGVSEPHTLKAAQVTDGLSKTLLLGEVTSVGFVNGNPRGLDRMGDGVPFTPSRAYARAAFVDVTVDGSIGRDPWKKANGAAPGAWIYTEPGPGNSGPPGISGPVFMTRGGINSDYLGAHSFHLGFIDIAMCDGAVRPVRETTDWRIWNLICSADDTQVSGE